MQTGGQLYKRVGVDDAKIMLAISTRTLLQWCAEGKIPWAVKIGGKWSFDAEAGKKWVEEQQREQFEWRSQHRAAASKILSSSQNTVICAEKKFGAKSNLMDKSIAVRFEQLMSTKRRSA